MRSLRFAACALIAVAILAVLTAQAAVAPAPSRSDVRYGPHERNVLDFWQAQSATAQAPAPVVVYFHGGGFSHGDKSKVRDSKLVQQCLDAGISVAAVNYRFRETAPLPEIFRDCARAIQFLRTQSAAWRIDPERIAAYGSSAGAGASLWLAFHPDLADPTNADPVLRESSHVRCAASISGQFTYDILRWPELFGEELCERFAKPYVKPAFYGLKTMEELRGPVGERVRADCDLLKLMTKDAPPIFVSASLPTLALTDANEFLHHPKHSQRLVEQARQLGVSVVAVIPALSWAPPPGQPKTLRDFLFTHLRAPRAPDSKL